jgi:hypothetical protein
MKLEFSQQILKKYSNIKFHENPSTGNAAVQCVQMDGLKDRHNEANSRLSHFCERA